MLVRKAKRFAIKAHGNQIRKYTGIPYWKHLEDVANICKKIGLSDAAQAAAWLHDTIEDTDVTYDDVEKEFGPTVAKLVLQLTKVSNLEDGNRAFRKAMDRANYKDADPVSQSIKLADILSNSRDIMKYDPKFGKVFFYEVEQLLPYLRHGNPYLFKKVSGIVHQAKKELGF